ncbi:MAG: hypothetical protein FD169_2073 [Bacillota bacterium]|nr:MAG: hypothetical protein FD169_2073 [Bacillota bacterium]
MRELVVAQTYGSNTKSQNLVTFTSLAETLFCMGLTLVARQLFLLSGMASVSSAGAAFSKTIGVLLGSEPGRWSMLAGLLVFLAGGYVSTGLLSKLYSGIRGGLSRLSYVARGLWFVVAVSNVLLMAYYSLLPFILLMIASILIILIAREMLSVEASTRGPVYVRSHYRKMPRRH